MVWMICRRIVNGSLLYYCGDDGWSVMPQVAVQYTDNLAELLDTFHTLHDGGTHCFLRKVSREMIAG